MVGPYSFPLQCLDPTSAPALSVPNTDNGHLWHAQPLALSSERLRLDPGSSQCIDTCTDDESIPSRVLWCCQLFRHIDSSVSMCQPPSSPHSPNAKCRMRSCTHRRYKIRSLCPSRQEIIHTGFRDERDMASLSCGAELHDSCKAVVSPHAIHRELI